MGLTEGIAIGHMVHSGWYLIHPIGYSIVVFLVVNFVEPSAKELPFAATEGAPVGGWAGIWSWDSRSAAHQVDQRCNPVVVADTAYFS